MYHLSNAKCCVRICGILKVFGKGKMFLGKKRENGKKIIILRGNELKMKIIMRNLSITIHSILHDEKINAYSVAFEMPKLDYLSIIDDIIKNNELQRKRVKRASSVYALMKQDLKAGCLLPAIVLSLDKGLGEEDENILEILEKKGNEKIANYINQNAEHIKILDGLQRTNMLQDVDRELARNLDNKFYQKNLRFEMYIGISRYGILYRMLTLNTGQTQMSLRHQVEILYSDLYTSVRENIYLIRESDNNKDIQIGRYNFNDMIEGMVSYLEESELTIDRFDILEYIKYLEHLSRGKFGNSFDERDIFQQFVETYHLYIQQINNIFGEVCFNKERLTTEEDGILKGRKPFGENMLEIMTTSQAITGFGAAISQQPLQDIQRNIKKIHINGERSGTLNLLIIRLAQIRNSEGRIGDTQRKFFRLFFRSLFDERITNFEIEKAISDAFRITP